ncbi:hypothetical protein GQ44DRAFT_764127 [Phaeosphaeriaceae sp. PMI808]|nr:hypothetical protein GQ44DRAFT_764127 [Phaeosphaeriaceae sp. PMI808]
MSSELDIITSSKLSRSEDKEEASTDRSNLRSCYDCHRRKVRCDKMEPCTPCRGLGKACSYPPVGPRIRRTKKAIMADMATRILSLEKSLAEAQRQQPGSEINRKSPRSNSVLQSPSQSLSALPFNFNGRSREEILVQRGSSSQYFNEVFLSRVIDEEHDVELALVTTQMESPHPAGPLSINALGILSSPSLSAVPFHYHPPKQTAVKLWKTYTNNVEGCAGLRLLHHSTDEIKIYSVIDNPATAPLDDLAMAFAVYFAAISALDIGETQATLGQDKQTLLFRFKVGLEQSFAHGDFLSSPTVTGLQALAIYLCALRVHNCGKGLWILDGLAIRIAHALGLHRDGKILGLSPFQSETRRRLWWHLISREIRSGEDYGLEIASSPLLTSDVGLPANIDDTDISPDMQEHPKPKVGWTAMTFSLIQIELAKTVQRLQWFLQRNTDPQTDFVTEANLLEALDLIFPRINDDELLRQYAWAGKVFPQYHATMYILWHLCVRPEGPNVDRAWQAIEKSFSNSMRDDSVTRLGSKSPVLAALRKKAMLMRQRIQDQNANLNIGEPPSEAAGDRIYHGSRFRDSEFNNDGLPEQRLEDTCIDELGIEYSEDRWLDWNALVQSFQLNSPAAF